MSVPLAPPLIQLQQLGLHYTLGSSRIDVLRDVTVNVAAGQSVAVAGPSGSGKTSLLLLLAGLERPAAGRVLLEGTDLASLGRDALADLRRDRVGIIFQSFHLLPSLTALDNVALPLQIAGRPQAFEAARQMLQRVGLGERLHHHPSQMSGGEQQRVAIARALVRDLLFELQRESGATLVLVTHDLAFAARCDRVLYLREAQLHEGLHEKAPVRVAEERAPGHAQPHPPQAGHALPV